MIIRVLIGAVVGGGLGFAYYKFVGCSTGTCPLTSNPYVSTLYGMTVGALLATGLSFLASDYLYIASDRFKSITFSWPPAVTRCWPKKARTSQRPWASAFPHQVVHHCLNTRSR